MSRTATASCATPGSSSTMPPSLRPSSASAANFSQWIQSSTALRRCMAWATVGPRKRRRKRLSPASSMSSHFRIALGIRAQLLLVLTVFLAIPWLGYEYVRELERFLRDAQEKTLAGTAQAVATALHDRPRLFEAQVVPRETLSVDRSRDASQEPPVATAP